MESESKNKLKKSFIILNDKGLHTRPATELVKCASVFKSQIFLIYQGLNVNAKSLLGILMLAATRGAKIEIEAEGIDAEDAVTAIIKLASAKFNIQY
ncbi:MAG: HPr family phosphocarrier protein [Chlamydiales bacterium]|nr:HPr family phosphocarrier protein [Chlamydiia bacterium]MCP5504815.1 HPr family phosphocarrier protein [Chlamydiales bacterium]